MDLTRRLDPARSGEQDLIDARFPAFNFDVIHGISYRIDPTEPSRFDPDGKLVSAGANRIRDLAWNGAPVPDDALFMVATKRLKVALLTPPRHAEEARNAPSRSTHNPGACFETGRCAAFLSMTKGGVLLRSANANEKGPAFADPSVDCEA